MAMIETVFQREHWEIDLRLAQMALARIKLLAVVEVARTESLNAATPFHAANGSGTMAYQNGVWGLRYHFVSDDWKTDRSEGVESIRNDKLKLRLGFANVDRACDDSHVPQPRTSKGAGAERVSQSSLFENLPNYAPRPNDGEWAFYYLMVDLQGWAELTRPIVKRGSFHTPVERIYLLRGTDGAAKIDLLDDNSDAVSNFDPQIQRKA